MGLGSGIRDPGSGKNLFRIPDPGVKKALDPGSGSATLEKVIGKNKAKSAKNKKLKILIVFTFELFFSGKQLLNIAEHFAYQSTQFPGIWDHHKILLILNAYAQKVSIFRHLGKK
jgi:hypothetical protein